MILETAPPRVHAAVAPAVAQAEPSVSPASETGKLLGHGPTLTALGQTWRLSPATWGIQQEYELWLESRAQARLKARLKAAMDADEPDETAVAEANAELRDFRTRRDAGAFAWRGEVFSQSLQGDGLAKMLGLLLRKHHGDVDDKQLRAVFVAAPKECLAAIREAIGDDPNS